jgi:hypothetical protein
MEAHIAHPCAIAAPGPLAVAAKRAQSEVSCPNDRSQPQRPRDGSRPPRLPALIDDAMARLTVGTVLPCRDIRTLTPQQDRRDRPRDRLCEASGRKVDLA